MPFFSLGEAWDTYEARFEDALPWLKVNKNDLFGIVGSACRDARSVVSARAQGQSFIGRSDVCNMLI